MEQDTFILMSKDMGNLETDINLVGRAKAQLDKRFPGWKYIDKIELKSTWLLIIRYPVTYNPSQRGP